MNLKIVFHRLTQGFGVCLPLLIALGLLIPGCAGKRSDLLSSLISPKASTSDSDEESSLSADDAQPDDDKSGLIAAADEQSDSSRLSVFTTEEVVEGPHRLRKRFRSLFSRRDDALATSDPFLNNEEAEQKGPDTKTPRESIAKGEGSKVDELLASFQSNSPKQPISDVKPWWESSDTSDSCDSIEPSKSVVSKTIAANARANFSQEFDSRLERLRAELALTDAEIAANQIASTDKNATADTKSAEPSKNDVNPFETKDNEVAIVEKLHPSLMTKPQSAQTADATPDRKLLGDAKARVKAMMADAHRDWENWNLQRAHQTALDAQKLANQEKVPFLAEEERPQELAKLIAADIRGDVVRTVSRSEPTATPPANPTADNKQLGAKSAAATFGFAELDRLANPWTAKNDMEMAILQKPDPAETVASEPLVESHSSGVSLLPPDDDFPSDADRGTWGQEFSPISPTPTDTKDVQLAAHKFSGFSLTRDEQIRNQMTGLSAEDNQALLKSMAEQKNRVFESKAIQWPELPSPNQLRQHSQLDDGPIRVAKAPRFALEDDMAVAATINSEAKESAPAGQRSLLGQFWRSQPIWFIGGLVLLVLALRLLPWPRNESA